MPNIKQSRTKTSSTNRSKRGVSSKRIDLHSTKTRILLTILIFAVIGGGFTVFKSFAATDLNLALTATECLNKGEAIYSSTTDPNRSKLIMQTDGNLVVYDYLNKARWWTSTNKTGGNTACMQPDGNFVIRDITGKAVWHSYTFGLKESFINHPSYRPSLYFLDHASTILMIGDMQINSTTKEPYESALQTSRDNMGGSYWRSNYGNTLNLDTPSGSSKLDKHRSFMPKNTQLTSINGKYKLKNQSDGNLVLYNAVNAPIWYTGVRGGDFLGISSQAGMAKGILSSIYNYSLIDATKSSWYVGFPYSTNTPPPRLVMQDDGNLVVYGGPDGRAMWQTATYGK